MTWGTLTGWQIASGWEIAAMQAAELPAAVTDASPVHAVALAAADQTHPFLLCQTQALDGTGAFVVFASWLSGWSRSPHAPV